jgi:hypothetical protein
MNLSPRIRALTVAVALLSVLTLLVSVRTVHADWYQIVFECDNYCETTGFSCGCTQCSLPPGSDVCVLNGTWDHCMVACVHDLCDAENSCVSDQVCFSNANQFIASVCHW